MGRLLLLSSHPARHGTPTQDGSEGRLPWAISPRPSCFHQTTEPSASHLWVQKWLWESPGWRNCMGALSNGETHLLCVYLSYLKLLEDKIYPAVGHAAQQLDQPEYGHWQEVSGEGGVSMTLLQPWHQVRARGNQNLTRYPLWKATMHSF